MSKLTEEQIQEAFKSARDGDPLFLALMQTLDDAFLDECQAAIRPELNQEARSYNSGRAQAVSDIRSFILLCRGLTVEEASSRAQTS